MSAPPRGCKSIVFLSFLAPTPSVDWLCLFKCQKNTTSALPGFPLYSLSCPDCAFFCLWWGIWHTTLYPHAMPVQSSTWQFWNRRIPGTCCLSSRCSRVSVVSQKQSVDWCTVGINVLASALQSFDWLDRGFCSGHRGFFKFCVSVSLLLKPTPFT